MIEESGPKNFYELMNKPGFVVYQRQSKWFPWEHFRQGKEAQVQQSFENVKKNMSKSNSKNFKNAGEHLVKMSEIELKHEKELLASRLGVDASDIISSNMSEYITSFNQAIIGKEKLKQIIDQLKMAEEQHKQNSPAGQLAASITSLYPSKLMTAIRQFFNTFLRANAARIITGDRTVASDWEQYFDMNFFNIATSTFTSLLKSTGKKNRPHDIYGSDSNLTDLISFFDNAKQESLLGILRSKMGASLDRIKNVLFDEDIFNKVQKQLINNKQLRGLLTQATKVQGPQLSGAVNELYQTLRVELQGAAEGRVMSSEMQKIDNTTIYTREYTIDLEKIIDELDISINLSNSLNETAKIYEKFYNEHFSKLGEEDFILFTSGKSYGFRKGTGFSGFEDGGTRKLSDTMEIFAANGREVQLAQDFFTAVVNTMEGAVLEEEHDTLVEYLRSELYSAMAYLFFDDWVAIGNESNKNVIHAFTLNDLYVPLSFLLKAAGEVLKKSGNFHDVTSYVNITLTLPEAIKFPEIEDYPIGTHIKKDGTAEDNGHNATQAWIEQQQEVLTQSKFAVSFLKNFYDEIVNNLPDKI